MLNHFLLCLLIVLTSEVEICIRHQLLAAWPAMLCVLQVVRHVESWNVSAWQALLQIVTPGPRQ